MRKGEGARLFSNQEGESIGQGVHHEIRHVLSVKPELRQRTDSCGGVCLRELGMDNISKHVWSLTRYLYEHMMELRHGNGAPVVEVYGKHDQADPKVQGAYTTVASAVMTKDGGEAVTREGC